MRHIRNVNNKSLWNKIKQKAATSCFFDEAGDQELCKCNQSSNSSLVKSSPFLGLMLAVLEKSICLIIPEIHQPTKKSFKIPYLHVIDKFYFCSYFKASISSAICICVVEQVLWLTHSCDSLQNLASYHHGMPGALSVTFPSCFWLLCSIYAMSIQSHINIFKEWKSVIKLECEVENVLADRNIFSFQHIDLLRATAMKNNSNLLGNPINNLSRVLFQCISFVVAHWIVWYPMQLLRVLGLYAGTNPATQLWCMCHSQSFNLPELYIQLKLSCFSAPWYLCYPSLWS